MTSTALLRRVLPCAVAALVLAGPGTDAPRAQSGVLVATGAVWKYLDNGSNQGTAWRAPAFNDGDLGVRTGTARLWRRRRSDRRVFGPNSSAKYITTYFRHAFSVADPSRFQSADACGCCATTAPSSI